MIVLTNCLSNVEDEGSLKVANSLIRRVKNSSDNVTIISYERKTELSDMDLKINKFLINRQLIHQIRKTGEKVLYIPFPARALPTALRIFILSLFCRKRLQVVLSMNYPMNKPAKYLYRMSRAEICLLSHSVYQTFYKAIGEKAVYLKTGVDTKKFSPVNEGRQVELKEKYGIGKEKKVVLHVGHLHVGRNIEQLLKISEEYQVILVASSLEPEEQDMDVVKKLQDSPHIRIIQEYLPHIEEIYQLADVYFFPVVSETNCIDVPLSVLEAMSCGKPVVTTYYGELKAFNNTKGCYFLKSFEEKYINDLLDKAVTKEHDFKDIMKEYDWSHAVEYLSSADAD